MKTCLIAETTSRQHLFLKPLAASIASLPYCIVVIDDMHVIGIVGTVIAGTIIKPQTANRQDQDTLHLC